MSIPERQYGCPVEVTMEALGGKWKATILWWLRRSAKRPSQLKQLIPRISQKVLTTQLQELEADGLIDRQTYRKTPPRVEYSLWSKRCHSPDDTCARAHETDPARCRFS